MKKLLVIGLALVLCAAFAVPAFAATVDTDISVVSDGVAPIVKCKWETPDDADPGHACFGTQTLANPGTVIDGTPCELVIGEKQVCYWAVVTHTVSMELISGVYADVYHPLAAKQLNLSGEIDLTPGLDGDSEWCGSHKYQVELLPYMVDNNPAAVVAFQSAVDQNLVTFNGYDAAEIIEELVEGNAELYMGCEIIHNHQPAGDYRVDVSAASGSAWSSIVTNDLTFAELNSFLLDFTGINYGQVAVGYEKQIDGDNIFCTEAKPTVWNNGNTYIKLNVAQNDAGFGQRSVGGQLVWNVHWAARLGNEDQGTKMMYDPNQDPVELPELLIMCTPTKLDFFILVDKAPQGDGLYEGTLTIGSTAQEWVFCDVGTL